MKKTLWSIGTGTALAVWMAVIFLFSAQPSAESSEISGSLSYRLVDEAAEVFHLKLSEWEILKKAEFLEAPIRKAAHMTEYAILGMLFFAFLSSLGQKGPRRFWLSFVLADCYAATDEIHQLVVPGRSGQFPDVCIDAAGVAAGLLLLGILLKIVRKRCAKRDIPLQ